MSNPDDTTDDRTAADDPDGDTEHEASKPGSGKQFAKNVDSPSDEGEARGSGKQFSKGAQHSDDDPEPSGSGKQFAPGHSEHQEHDEDAEHHDQ